MDTSLLRWMH